MELSVTCVEIVNGVGSTFAIFKDASNLPLFLAQFIPAEVIEQASAWSSHHPNMIKWKKRAKQKVTGSANAGPVNANVPANPGTVAPEPVPELPELGGGAGGGDETGDGGDEEEETPGAINASAPAVRCARTALKKAVDQQLARLGPILIGREGGEDMCFFFGATACIREVAELCFYNDSGDESPAGETDNWGSLANVFVALSIAFAIEHNLSAMGLFEFERNGVSIRFAWYTKHELIAGMLVGPVFFALLAVGQA